MHNSVCTVMRAAGTMLHQSRHASIPRRAWLVMLYLVRAYPLKMGHPYKYYAAATQGHGTGGHMHTTRDSARWWQQQWATQDPQKHTATHRLQHKHCMHIQQASLLRTTASSGACIQHLSLQPRASNATTTAQCQLSDTHSCSTPPHTAHTSRVVATINSPPKPHWLAAVHHNAHYVHASQRDTPAISKSTCNKMNTWPPHTCSEQIHQKFDPPPPTKIKQASLLHLLHPPFFQLQLCSIIPLLAHEQAVQQPPC